MSSPAQEVIDRVTAERAASNESTIQEGEFYTIFIAGPSGSGKSTSLRNISRDKTILISTENRKFPFRGGNKFTMKVPVKNFIQFEKAFYRAIKSDKGDLLVVDSFTSAAEFAYREIIKKTTDSGGDTRSAWLVYRDRLHDILLAAKQCTNKHVVFTGIDSFTQDDQGRMIKAVDVQGSLHGKIEKEFDLVFWTKVLDVDVTDEGADRHKLVTNSDGMCKAKSPMGMFPDLLIDNDLKAIINRIEEFEAEEGDL